MLITSTSTGGKNSTVLSTKFHNGMLIANSGVKATAGDMFAVDHIKPRMKNH
jgi:hypothetical protein